jgi:hypothetical protein
MLTHERAGGHLTMNHLYTVLALDIANERVREAEDDRRTKTLLAGTPGRPSFVRRGLAIGLAAVTRGTASAVRRLDDCVADDLGRSLATTE